MQPAGTLISGVVTQDFLRGTNALFNYWVFDVNVESSQMRGVLQATRFPQAYLEGTKCFDMYDDCWEINAEFKLTHASLAHCQMHMDTRVYMLLLPEKVVMNACFSYWLVIPSFAIVSNSQRCKDHLVFPVACQLVSGSEEPLPQCSAP